MHPILQFAVDQAQVECQVGILQEKRHNHGVSIAHASDTLVPYQEDQVNYPRTHPVSRITVLLDWMDWVCRMPVRSGRPGALNQM